jgi:hypothetical protein
METEHLFLDDDGNIWMPQDEGIAYALENIERRPAWPFVDRPEPSWFEAEKVQLLSRWLEARRNHADFRAAEEDAWKRAKGL